MLIACLAAAQDTAPRAIFAPDPDYTPEAAQRGIAGKVYLKLEVLPDGRTNNIRVEKGLDPELDRSAIEAVAQWRFQPATKNGTPVSTEIIVVVRFAGWPASARPGVYTGLPCAPKIDSRDIEGLLKKASRGDPKAQYIIGCACEYGVARLAPDRARAIDWYRKAAEAGHVPAQHFLGEAYLRHFDYVQAYKWLRIADWGGYKGPSGAEDDVHHPGLKTVTLLLSVDQLREAEQQVEEWKRQHGAK